MHHQNTRWRHKLFQRFLRPRLIEAAVLTRHFIFSLSSIFLNKNIQKWLSFNLHVVLETTSFFWLFFFFKSFFYFAFFLFLVTTPWFEAYRENFLQSMPASDHEFLNHYLACILLTAHRSDQWSIFCRQLFFFNRRADKMEFRIFKNFKTSFFSPLYAYAFCYRSINSSILTCSLFIVVSFTWFWQAC